MVQSSYQAKLHYVKAQWEHRDDQQIERERDTCITPERMWKRVHAAQGNENK
ncbi:hypothetical protein GGI00_004547, partial [Coemansia sp. RSA 2681]